MLRSVLSIGLLLSLAQASPHPHIKKASSHTHAATVGPNRVLSPAVHPDVDPSNINNLKACANASLFYSGAQDSAAANTMGLVTVPATQYPVVQLENSGSLHNMSCTTTSAQIDFVNSQAYQTAVSDWTSQGTFALVTYNPNCGAGFESDKREFILVKSLTPVPATNSIVVNAQFVDFQTVVGNASDVTVDFGPNIAAQTVSKRGSKSLSDTFPFNEYATSDTTPFGAGYQLFSDSTLTLDCVGCGTQGSITISGSVSYSIFPPGIHSVSVGTNGNLAVTMVVGVVANGLHVNVPIDTINILTVPLTPFEIPGIFSIGPQIQLQAKAAIGVTATGSLLSGVTLDWPAFSATINADGNGASASGFTPTVTPTNSANGTISASLNVGLPVSFGIGINILDGLLTKSISLVDEPGVSFTASGSNVGPCDGVGLSVGVFNDVSVSVLGITSIPVASWNDTLASVCISDGATPPAAPTSTSIVVPPPTTTPTPAVAVSTTLSSVTVATLTSSSPAAVTLTSTRTNTTTFYSSNLPLSTVSHPNQGFSFTRNLSATATSASVQATTTFSVPATSTFVSTNTTISVFSSSPTFVSSNTTPFEPYTSLLTATASTFSTISIYTNSSLSVPTIYKPSTSTSSTGSFTLLLPSGSDLPVTTPIESTPTGPCSVVEVMTFIANILATLALFHLIT